MDYGQWLETIRKDAALRGKSREFLHLKEVAAWLISDAYHKGVTPDIDSFLAYLQSGKAEEVA